MRAWQLLACVALAHLAVSAAFSFSDHSHEAYSGDLEVAASGHHDKHHESGFEESGGQEHGEEHHSKVSSVNSLCK